MAVTGCDRVYLGILCFPHFYWTHYDRDDGEIAAILDAEKAFWELVENDTPPDTDGSDSTTEALSEQYKEVYPEEVIHLSKSSGADASLIMIEEVKKQIKDLKEIQTEHENKLKSLLGNSGNGYTEDWNVSWKEQSRKTVDTDLLKKEHPDIYQEYIAGGKDGAAGHSNPVTVEGYTAERIMQEVKLHPIGAYLMLVKLRKDPEKAKKTLARGIVRK